MADDKISFSKEVAETLNIESAIILDKCNQDIFKKIRSKDVLIERLSNELTFIKKDDIEKSLDELLRFNLVKKYQQEDSRSNLRLPRAKPFEKQDMGNGWLPSSEAMDVLEMGSIEESFISKKIPEFRIYWMERGQQRNNWNSTFIDYIRREWAKENNSNKGLPFPISKTWVPSDDVYQILSLSNITEEDASPYLAEFILYWTDNGSAFNTWNSKFIYHVKRRHLVSNKNQNEKSKNHSEPGTFKQGFDERKKDKSWAEEINFE